MRACQREGLFRIERDRQGVMRIFPRQRDAGSPPSRFCAVDDDVPIEETRGDERSHGATRCRSADGAGGGVDHRSVEAATPDVVDGDVVQEIDTPPSSTSIDVAPAEEAEPATQAWTRTWPRAAVRRAGVRRGRRDSSPRQSRERARAAAKPRAPRGSHAQGRTEGIGLRLSTSDWLERQQRIGRRFDGVVQVVDADAEQADRPSAGVRLIEERHGARRDVVGVAGRRELGVAPRDGREVRVADLDRHRPAQQRPALQPRRALPRHLVDRGADLLRIGEVLRERVLGARRLRGAVRRPPADRRCPSASRAASPPGCRPPRAASRDRRSARRPAVRCRDRAAALRSPGPTPHKRIDRQLLEEALDALRRDDGQAVRLLPRRGNLREELVRSDAGRRRQSGRLADLPPSAVAPRAAERLVPRRSRSRRDTPRRATTARRAASPTGRSRTPTATRPDTARNPAGR